MKQSLQESTPEFTIEDDPIKQWGFLENAYSKAIELGHGVVISDEVLARYRDIVKSPAGELVSAIRSYYERMLKGRKVSVAVNNCIVEVLFENDGKRKSVGWRMSPEKAATFEYLTSLLDGAVYAYSQKNRSDSERRYVPNFHYFVNNANIGGIDMPIKIQVRDLNLSSGIESRYYTHNTMKGKGNASPGLRNDAGSSVADVSSA